MNDECTVKKLRSTYDRILIEVDVTRKLKDHICIKDHAGRKIDQAIEYQWQPLYYATCLKLGHNCSLKKHAIQSKHKPKPAAKTKMCMPAPEQPGHTELV